MTSTADSAQNLFRNVSNYSTQTGDAVINVIAVFKSLSVDEQLAVLWFTYTEMGRSITPAATGSARLRLATGLLNQIKQMTHDQQLQVMRDLAAQNNTHISRSYGVLSPNTKLAFWYELSEMMLILQSQRDINFPNKELMYLKLSNSSILVNKLLPYAKL